MVQPREARELCSASEWRVVKSSLSPLVETLSASDLKKRLEHVRKLYRKGSDLVSRQHSESRKRTTRRKNEMFAEAVDRFRAALDLIGHTGDAQPVTKNNGMDVSENTSRHYMDALQYRNDHEFANRNSQSLSALAEQAEQLKSKSGTRGIQGHVAAANRRQQGRRDTKNR